MGQTIKYEKMDKMLPRDGVIYSTVYVKQTPEQRQRLVQHIRTVCEEILESVERQGDDWFQWMNTPLKGFKTTQGVNRTAMVILEDMAQEAKGQKKNGEPKDFALAPIDRWNKLFHDTDYEIILEKQGDSNLFRKFWGENK